MCAALSINYVPPPGHRPACRDAAAGLLALGCLRVSKYLTGGLLLYFAKLDPIFCHILPSQISNKVHLKQLKIWVYRKPLEQYNKSVLDTNHWEIIIINQLG